MSIESAGLDFEDFYRQTYGRSLALAIAFVRERAVAEDLTQDAYAQLWRHWASVETPSAWLRRAVLSNCTSYLRTRRRRDAILRRQPSPNDVADAAGGTHIVVLDLLRGLTERQRVAVVLRFVDDLTEAEIAAVLGCRPGTVKSTLHRALKVLRKHWDEEQS